MSRHAESRLHALLAGFPAVYILGPRQCGKTTLVQNALPGWRHLDLERPADFDLLSADIELFFQSHPGCVVIDEAQRLPELFPALRYLIDQDRRPGRIVLLGSANPSLVRAISESLAGRVALVEMTPLLATEVAGRVAADDRWFRGGFPPPLGSDDAAFRSAWFSSYLATFLERDLPALGLRLPPVRLRKLCAMLTHVHGQLLNVSDLARSLTVASGTIQNDLDVLEGAFLIRRLSPYHANVQKRLTKSPKSYVRDSGLLHALAGLRHPGEMETWNRRGASFEGHVIEELIGRAAVRSSGADFHFWRTQAGSEVDLLVSAGRAIFPVEIKLGVAVGRYDLAGLRQCMRDLALERGLVIYRGTEARVLGPGIEALPWDGIIRGTVPLPWEP